MILVVDDDPAICEFVRMALIDEGYDVQVAENGAVALGMIAQTPPNLVILDMRMPVMDGWAFLETYCGQEPPLAPVIAVSANRGIPGVVGCATAFIPKPFDLDVLINLVSKYTDHSN